MLSMRGYPSTRVPTSPRQPCSTDSATSADSPPTTGNASASHRTSRRSVGVALSPDCDIAASVPAERYGVATAGMSLLSTTGLRAAGQICRAHVLTLLTYAQPSCRLILV